MSDDKLTIYVWPDNSWISEEDVDDLDWYMTSTGKGDDYKEYYVPIELDSEDIDELIQLEALPGMLPDSIGKVTSDLIAESGEIPIGENDIIIISHSKDIDYNAVTILEDRAIINAPEMTLKIVKGKGKI